MKRKINLKIIFSVCIGHFLRDRLLKGRCNICMYVLVCSCVCVCARARTPVCVLLCPPDPTHTVGLNSRIPPTPTSPLNPVPASVPASKCVTYPWEELPLKKRLSVMPFGRPVFGQFPTCGGATNQLEVVLAFLFQDLEGLTKMFDRT